MREIKEFPGYYITRDGRVWSRIARNGSGGLTDTYRLMKARKNEYGYPFVMLGGKNRKKRFIHRLLLETFVGPCPPGMQCRHLDGDPGNYSMTNIEWGTPLQNIEDRRRHGTDNSGERNGHAKFTNKEAVEIRRRYAVGDISQAELAREYGVDGAGMCNLVNRKTYKDC